MQGQGIIIKCRNRTLVQVPEESRCWRMKWMDIWMVCKVNTTDQDFPKRACQESSLPWSHVGSEVRTRTRAGQRHLRGTRNHSEHAYQIQDSPANARNSLDAAHTALCFCSGVCEKSFMWQTHGYNVVTNQSKILRPFKKKKKNSQ